MATSSAEWKDMLETGEVWAWPVDWSEKYEEGRAMELRVDEVDRELGRGWKDAEGDKVKLGRTIVCERYSWERRLTLAFLHKTCPKIIERQATTVTAVARTLHRLSCSNGCTESGWEIGEQTHLKSLQIITILRNVHPSRDCRHKVVHRCQHVCGLEPNDCDVTKEGEDEEEVAVARRQQSSARWSDRTDRVRDWSEIGLFSVASG